MPEIKGLAKQGRIQEIEEDVATTEGHRNEEITSDSFETTLHLQNRITEEAFELSKASGNHALHFEIRKSCPALSRASLGRIVTTLKCVPTIPLDMT